MKPKFQHCVWVLMMACLAAPAASVAQRVCKPGKRSPASHKVWIQLTDETDGKVVTFEKEFDLSAIPAAQRERYVDRLMDSLLYADAGTLRTREAAKPARPPANARSRVAIKR